MITYIKNILLPVYRLVRKPFIFLFGKPTRYEYLFTYIKKTKPQRILEIGTWNGNRAEKMIQTAQSASGKNIEYYGIDLFGDMDDNTFVYEISKRPPQKNEVEEKLKKTGANVVLIQGNTLTLPDSAWAALPKMDFVFIDGGHSLETIQNDWVRVQNLMHEKTVVIFDDYWNQTEAGARPIVDGINRYTYNVDILPVTDVFPKDGGGVLRVQFALVHKKPHIQD